MINSSQPATLQQKQQYLRTHIDQNQYQEFYEFCQNSLGNVDVNAWTLATIQSIIQKYNEDKKQKQKAEGHNIHEISYNQYQSAQIGMKMEHQYEDNDARSSRIVKSSAVDLLDEAFQTSSVTSQKFQNNQPERRNTMNFDQFDFWSSTMPSKQQPKQNRQKSITQHVNNNYNSPTFPSTKPHTPKYDPKYSNKNRNSIQYNPDLNSNDIFGPQPSYNKKTSPYMKKQQLDQPYLINNNNYSNYNSNYRSNKFLQNNQGYKVNDQEPRMTSSYVYQDNGNNLGSMGYTENKSNVQKIKIKEIRQYHPHNTRAQSQSNYRAGGSKISENSNNNTSNNNSNNNSNTNNNNNNNSNTNNENNSKWILQQKKFHEKVKCFKSTIRNQLSSPNLNVLIDQKFQIIQRNLLASNYAMYTLKVVPLNIQCKRNYDDFSRLKKNLQKFFPGVHLAYLEDNSWFSATDNDFIEKQKKMIEMFMRDLLRNRQVRNSRVMEDFLTLTEHKSIKRKFEKYDKMVELQGIEQLCVLDGQVTVTISSQQKNYLTQLNRFINKMDSLYQRHRRLTDSLTKQYNQLMSTFSSLIRIMDQYQKQIKQFNTKITTNQLKHLGSVYKVLKQTYKEDLSSFKFQYEVNTKKIVPFLRYQHENMLELKKLLEYQSKFTKLYEKRIITERIDSVDDYWSEKTRFGKKGILEESRNILVLKYQVGYLGYQARNQGERVFNQMGYKILKKWQNIAESYLDRFTKNIQYRKKLSRLDCQKYLPVLVS